ncbi:hypothetical protein ACIBF5_29980 [Micromonospora sp. NPDC050417]|uniref:hypothetical protein n=1 Tax=Micromonospora sp. NPDC050417 TaxID=3364280 RepID=UPI0037B6981B
MPPRITHDDKRVADATVKMNNIRSQNAAARAGINPGDTGHPHGLPWANLTVSAGGENFASGAYLKKRLAEIGTAVDKVLASYETRLATTSRALSDTRRGATDTERDNVSHANDLTIPPPAATWTN